MALPLRIGIYSPFFGSTVGGGEKYLGVTAEAVRDAFPTHEVEIISPVPADRSVYERMLALDLRGIELISTRRRVTWVHRLLNAMPSLRLYRDLLVSAQAARFTAHYDLFLSMVYVLPAFSRARQGVILCQFPYTLGAPGGRRGPATAWLYKLYSLPYRLLRPRMVGDEVEAFSLVICQSEYVRHWVREYWHRDATVINPPIDVPDQEPDWGSKEPIILSVGRFFAGGHTKRHDLMVRAFKELCQSGLKGWELHLAGSVHRDGPNAAYFARVKEMAKGFPVVFHPDASYAEVQSLYERATVYWHAAGFGKDPEKDPISLEHFGMTTAEAMGHGTVPVVIALGGQPEVVREGVDGFQWSDLAELKEKTTRLVQDPELSLRLGRAARQSSFRFSRATFKAKMVASLRPLVAELEKGELSPS